MEKYFEIKISKELEHPLSEIGVAYVFAKSSLDAQKKIRKIDVADQIKFHAFRKKFLFLTDDALKLSDDAIENGFDLIDRKQRIKCFHETLFRVYLSGVEDEEIGFVAWMIITKTSEIIEDKNQERLIKKK
jgi:hypothetical protein